MITAAKQIALILGLTASSSLWAATYNFEAITDFSDINAGAVPYYRHNEVNALAINAAIESHRDVFARATLVFEQSAGVYDVTITSLGEIDGDGTFQFLVNGTVMGTAINDPAIKDYLPQYHTFYNISIPEGALIGVESNAISNGAIPEGDGFAFARGRWTNLSLTSVDTVSTVSPDVTIDLALTISADSDQVEVGDIIVYHVTLTNQHETNTATAPVAGILLPDSMQFEASDSCIANNQSVSCSTPEIAPGADTSITFSARTVSADSFAQLFASASSSQLEDNVDNNEAQLVSVINPVALSIEPSQNTTTAPVNKKASGGGALSLLMLPAMAIGVSWRRRRITDL